MRKHGAFLMQKIRDISEICTISTEYKRKKRHDGFVDIIVDGLKNGGKFMAETTTTPVVEQQTLLAQKNVRTLSTHVIC